jgi:hypothetical protein
MQGWDADTHLEHPSLSMGVPLEDLDVTLKEREENISSQLKQSADSKRALILKVSHTGGHKYAGNCIVSYPHAVVVCYDDGCSQVPVDIYTFRVRYLVWPGHPARCRFNSGQHYSQWPCTSTPPSRRSQPF